MVINRQYTALEWVIKEISDSLRDCQRILKNYASDPEDLTQLHFCKTLIHQVDGSLRMLGFHGAAMLTEEMEALTQALLEKNVRDHKEALEVLEAALRHSPEYLEQVQQTKQDYPALILSLLNDIRSVRGEVLLSESALFTPDLSRAHQLSGEAHPITQNSDQLRTVVKKLRQMYQYAAASVFHKININENLSYLFKASVRLKKLLQGTKHFAVWEIASAMIDGLCRKEIQPSASIKNLLRDLDGQLKQLEQKGTEALEDYPSDELLKNLLYYVGNSTSSSPAITTVCERYQLHRQVVGGGKTSRDQPSKLDIGTLRSVAETIRKELLIARSHLNECLRGNHHWQHFDSMQHALRRINDTLAVLGVSELRQRIKINLDSIAAFKEHPQNATAEKLEEIADCLKEIELKIDKVLNRTRLTSNNVHHLNESQIAILEKCRNGLEITKDAILNNIASQQDLENIQSISDQLRKVHEYLLALSLDRAAEIISACIFFIESKWLGESLQLKWQQVDNLADIIASADYYLEFMSAVHENNLSILDKAEKALSSLGISKADVNPLTPREPSEANDDTNSETAIPESVKITDEDDEIDEEIVEIFVEEYQEIQERLDEFFPQWAKDFNNEEALAETRRAFHTLKGSGRMVKATDIGELAWSIENMLNRIMDRAIPASELQAALIQKVLGLLPDMLNAYQTHEKNPQASICGQFMDWAHQIARSETCPEAQAYLIEKSGEGDEQSFSTDHAPDSSGKLDFDPQLWKIFKSEAEEHLNTLQEFIDNTDISSPTYKLSIDAMQRALHTLNGSAHMAGLTSIAELIAPLEKFIKELRSYRINIDEPILQLIKNAVIYAGSALTQIERGQYPTIEQLDQFVKRVSDLRAQSIGQLILRGKTEDASEKIGPASLDVLIAGGIDLLMSADLMIDQWHTGQQTTADWQALHDELSRLKENAERGGLTAIKNLSAALQKVYAQLLLGQINSTSENYRVLLVGHEQLINNIDAIAANQELPSKNEALLQQLTQLTSPTVDPSPSELDGTYTEAEALSNITTNDPLEPYDRTNSDDIDDDIDKEAIGFFLEEVHELLEELDESINSWESGAGNRESNEKIQRILHTLKGGARLSGMNTTGDLAHEFESFMVAHGSNDPTANLFAKIHHYQDQMITQVNHIQNREANNGVEDSPPPEAPMKPKDVNHPAIDEKSVATSPVKKIVSAPENLPSGNVVLLTANSPARKLPSPAIEPSTDRSQLAKKTAKVTAGPQEVVKVPASLMEELVNLAGETSISRGRMEKQIGELGFSLEEMGATVQRLQEQLRRLDIETEAQVSFRQEQMAENEGFDPLEMDRYSQLQQLSRSLVESASDLMDLKSTLTDKTREAETMLAQQSRINTGLQEGLMLSRMVPFSRIVPRLRRMVRQIAKELSKKISLDMGSVEGELDRNMLERLVAPLEHMLRNAIDHGIEDASVRERHGKTADGHIAVTLERDGGDVLIHVADDGGGIDVEKVRAKAIEHQLMNPDAELSDQEILQFILVAGFSTAKTITQISGRGVGLDVVSNEIRQMGGSVVINSQLGKGTTFTIRVPFTVSVNRALMVKMGDDRYAIPLNTIKGILRVSPQELEYHYTHPSEAFEYAGDNYQLLYLGTLLDQQAVPKLHSLSAPMPVLLVGSTDHSVAVQVDELQGSQEIVVKSMGTQFKSLQGVSGATIMGDGNVVIILDLSALIRSVIAQNLSYDLAALEAKAPTDQQNHNPLVMVVDDSVTVRKVTTRLLEREGYDVITARDGVDAMNTLIDTVPNIMLLDIEMPRMDGFEVARNVRSRRDLVNLPIIMITSRTGEKHRQRGLESGADIYMGKPYQERQLLENIRELIGDIE
ncbi:MAG: chemosensory pili system protein ChpA (sensor histidine kinase/response regulator) [Cellvibrionaceae bacterium]|jgi:chemosensory pili system protein ChpA (sensor histidine kinase/response regulator)